MDIGIKGHGWEDAYIALGSNLGDRYQYLRAGIHSLHNYDGIEVIAESSVYETKAVGFTEQPDFLNMVLRVRTNLTPDALLAACLAVEKTHGRIREQKWGPRTLDIDILIYGKLMIKQPDLFVPHPRMHERAFVLLPLRDLADELIHPEFGVTIQQMTEQVPGKEGVRKWEKPLENGCVPTGN